MEILQIIQQEIESRARELAEEMLAANARAEQPINRGKNGEIVVPYVFDGEQLLTCQQVETLTGVKYPALWKWKKSGKLPYRKVGGRILYS